MKKYVVLLAVVCGAGVAQAGPPAFAPVAEVLDYSSVASEATAAGGQVVLVIGGLALSMALLWMLIRRARRAVHGAGASDFDKWPTTRGGG